MGGIIIHCDGASRGNPGRAAAAFVVTVGGKVIYKSGKLLGVATNNVAEYSAVIEALLWVTDNPTDQSLVFVLDSQLIVNQLNGIYKIKNLTLQKLAQTAKKLEKDIGQKIVYRNVPRAQNREADTLVNQILDGEFTG
ncbi:MAG: ribonuclease HI [Microgenomates group bacterium Gr01-1014_5]|nr:MAG: ribonuclease HI [Microgenomates group bacterium Gr01-1014_5]